MPRRTNRHEPEQPTMWQRRALKSLARYARKEPGVSLSPDDWEAYMRFAAQPRVRAVKRIFRSLPSTPRCGYCGAPFSGPGGRLVGPLGYRPSRKNPNICAVCVEMAPPGGMTAEAGVLFADLRGFTELSERRGPEEATKTLRRFYGYAEHVFFPEALIDKLIGDEVMALYLPMIIGGTTAVGVADADRARVAALMLDHARDLFAHVGYGTSEGPQFEVGIGIDFGEAFIGNIGDGTVRDFTAVGDVVNTASRLQHAAAGGEVLVSSALARHLDAVPGPVETLTLKGKQERVSVHRIRWFSDTG